MAKRKYNGEFNFAGNLEVQTNAPLDARLVVDTKAELTLETTWATDGKMYLYNGMVVSVTTEKQLYMLTNFHPETAKDAYKTASNWVRIDPGAITSVIVNNLTSDSTTSPLAAAQGKVLKGLIDTANADITALDTSAQASITKVRTDLTNTITTQVNAINTHIDTSINELKDSLEETIDTKVSAVYRYKGSVAAYANLPTTGNVTGDTYNVVAAYGTTPAGTNWAWNGTAWDALGGTVDLSPYATTATLTATKNELNATITDVSSNLSTLKGRVDVLTDPTNANSIDKKLETLENSLTADITALDTSAKASIASLKTATDKAIADLDTSAGNAITALDTKLSKEIDDLDTSAKAAITAATTAASNALKTHVDNEFTPLKTKVQGIIDTSLANIDSSINKLRSDATAKHTAIDASISRLDSSVSALEDTLTWVEYGA